MPLPIIRGSSAPLYPFSRVVSCLTRVQAFENGNEQRFIVRAPLVNFSLPYSALSVAQTATIRAAHVSAKGQHDTTLSLVLGATTYTNLALLDDIFSAEEYSSTYYRSQYRLRQTIPQALTSNANGNVFPTILAELPYTRQHRFSTYVVDQETGPRYGYGLYGTGLTGFPTGPLGSWKLQWAMLSDTDLATLESFFVAMNGRYGEFSFTDPDDASVHTKCCFDQDDLEIKYAIPGLCSVDISISEKGN